MPASESQTFDWTWRKSRLNIAIIRLDIHAAPYQLNSSPNRLWFVSNIEFKYAENIGSFDGLRISVRF